MLKLLLSCSATTLPITIKTKQASKQTNPDSTEDVGNLKYKKVSEEGRVVAECHSNVLNQSHSLAFPAKTFMDERCL